MRNTKMGDEHMKRVTLEATDENILNSIKNNDYQRNSDVRDFIEALDTIEGNMFISLDGRWGEGKSFYIRQIEMALKYLVQKKWGNKAETDLDPYFQNPIWTNIDLKHSCFPVYYNAWYYDNHDDPLLSLLYVILKQYSGFIDTKIDQATLKQKFLSILPSFSVSLNGIGSISFDPKKVSEDLKVKDIFEEILLVEEIRNKVKKIFDQMITENAERLVIIVDELDRCRPSYAVEVLERIKHYFDDDRIIFIAAVNKEQLVHTLAKYYGENFDATRYLNKFFDYNVHMPAMKSNYSLQEENRAQYFLYSISDELTQYYKLTLRDALIFNENISRLPVEYVNDVGTQGCCLSLFVPIIIILEMIDQEQKVRFLNGDTTILEKICLTLNSAKKLVCAFGEDGTVDENNFDLGYMKIKSVYEYAFQKNDRDSYQQLKVDVSMGIKDFCIKACNGFKEQN